MNQYDQIKGGKTKRQKEGKTERQKEGKTERLNDKRQEAKQREWIEHRMIERHSLCGDGEGSSKKNCFLGIIPKPGDPPPQALLAKNQNFGQIQE